MQVHMCIWVNEGTHTHSMCVDVRGQFGCRLSPPTLFETALMLSSHHYVDCFVSTLSYEEGITFLLSSFD